MIHCKRNRQKRIKRQNFRTAVRKVLQRKANLAFRNRETSRLKVGMQHPWAAFLSREKNFHSDEVYNLDVATVLFLAPRIRLLVKGGFEKCGATPNWLADTLGHLDWKQWHTILKKMQFAFDTLEQSIDETGLYDLSELTTEQKDGIHEGLELFGKYMLYLSL